MLKYSHTPYLNLNLDEEKKGIKNQDADFRREESANFEKFFAKGMTNKLKSSSSSDGLSTNSEDSSTNNNTMQCSQKNSSDDYEQIIIIQTNSSEQLDELWEEEAQNKSCDSRTTHQEEVYYYEKAESCESDDQTISCDKNEDVVKKEYQKTTKSSSKISKFTKTNPTIQNNGRNINETIEITVTLDDENKGDSNINDEKKIVEEHDVSENEGHPKIKDTKAEETKPKVPTKKQQSSLPKKNTKSSEKNCTTSGKGNSSTSGIKEAKRSISNVVEKTNKKSVRLVLNGRESTDDTSTEMERKKTKRPKSKLKKKAKRRINADDDSKNIREIKKADSVFSVNSQFSATSSNIEENLLWANETKAKNQLGQKQINPMDQISIQCKKMFKDLLVEEDTISLSKLMEGQFNSTLILTLTQTASPPKIDKIYTPIRDPDLRSITPKVKRKLGTANLHERMVYQMRDTDSYDSFLNLMNKHKRQGLIKRAEKQDHNFLCQIQRNYGKRYRFTPQAFTSKIKNKKDLDKHINYLWFSQREFKLKSSCRVINRKKMEMYCQSLYRGSSIPRSKGMKRNSSSKLSLAPRRWIQTCPSRLEGDSLDRTLRYYEILDDLTVKDLAPFNSEYPRHDEQPMNTVGWRLLHKLAREDYSRDTENILITLIAPKWQYFEKSGKKKQKKTKVTRKFDNCGIYNHLHVQSISTRPNSTIKSSKLPHKVVNPTKFKGMKTNMRNSSKCTRKLLSRELQYIISQKNLEDSKKKNTSRQNVPFNNTYQKTNISNQRFTITPLNAFKKLDSDDPKQKSNKTKTPSRKHLPNLRDSQNVFQNVTVLPVGVSFQTDSLTDRFKKILVSK